MKNKYICSQVLKCLFKMKAMRHCICLLIMAISFPVFAQEEMISGFLFPDYTDGTVIYKNGNKVHSQFNYNTLHEQMCFLGPDNTIMAIGNASEISVIIIGDRRFYPASKDAFYEGIPVGENTFYIQWKSVSKARAKDIGLGYSTSTATTNVGYFSPQAKHLESTELFEGIDKRHFYLRDKNNTFKKFTSAKTLGKLFKGHGAKIENFAKKESSNFNKLEDVYRIVEYAYSLK